MYKTLFFIGFALMLAACNSDDISVSDCYDQKPSYDYISIKLSVNEKYRNIPICIYKDDMEDNKIVQQEIVNVEEWETELKLGEKYTITAQYIDGNDTIIVVDASQFYTTNSDENSDCWQVYGRDFDLRLKF